MSCSDRLLEFDLVLTKILPDRVAGAVASVEEGAAFQFAEEGALRAKAGAARQQEFIAGRKCARAALAELGQLHGPILANGKGAPVWPDGFVGSITHCKGFCG
ncbi:MAG: 4'-phosphopantetheinyl transferase, partial [Verrucomicrobiota bacterium]